MPPRSASSPPGASPASLLPKAALLRGLITLPLTVSYLIIGMGLLVLFNWIGVPKSLLAAGIGHVVINLPLCFAIIYSQMGDHQINIERAARDLGAPEWQVLALITVPVMWPALFASFFLSMTFSWDEFVISFLLTRFDTTLPVEIWNLLRSGLNPKTNAVGSLVFGVSIVLRPGLELVLAAAEAGVSRPLVEIRDVTHRFGAARRAGSTSRWQIAPGSYTVLLGPSGSGKTTLLSILGGFLDPSEGKVLIGGRDCTVMPPAKRPTTTVFQDYALFPHMSVGSNVGFGLRMRGVDAGGPGQAGARGAGAGRPRRTRSTDGRTSSPAASGSAWRWPGRWWSSRPCCCSTSRSARSTSSCARQMQDELKAIQKRVGTAFVHVTHDQEEAMALGRSLRRDESRAHRGRRTARARLCRPATRFSAGFMGESTLLPGNIVDRGAGKARVETPLGRFDLPLPAAAGGKVTLAIRPEHLRLARLQDAAEAKPSWPTGSPRRPRCPRRGNGDRNGVPGQLQARARHLAASTRRSASSPGFRRPAPLKPGDSVAAACVPGDIILLTR